MNLFMRETAEKSDDMMVRAAAFFKEKARLLAVLDDAGMRLRFATTLFLFGAGGAGYAGGRRAGDGTVRLDGLPDASVGGDGAGI